MPEPLKNMFNEKYVNDLSAATKQFYPAFDTQAYHACIFDKQWQARELKDRMRHISTSLRPFLPEDYAVALSIMRQASLVLKGYSYEMMIFPDFVEVFGLDDWGASIPALEHFTQLCSSEFAVRPFIIRDQERMMAQMMKWAQHENHHVRRLASEGIRPRLPWGISLPAFKADPSPILPILEQLRDDESEYVRRSVANNLNDIAKDNPDVVLDVARRWHLQDTPETQWMIRHALRTLIKKGDPAALELLGYGGNGEITVKRLTVQPDQIAIGDNLTFSFLVESHADEPQNLMIDYIVHLMRSNGRQTPKVFKLSKVTLAPGETLTITRKHSFKPVTTRKYYPGEHAIAVQINGKQFEPAAFTVTE